MPVDTLAIDLFHIVGEEAGDVFIRRPVLRYAEVIAILGLELVLQVLTCEQVSTEPIQVGELLVGQLIQLLVRTGDEADADEIFQIEIRVRELFTRTSHEVGQWLNCTVAEVGADQIRIRNPAVINALARLHRGLQLLDHVTFLDQVMLDLDAGDFLKSLGHGL